MSLAQSKCPKSGHTKSTRNIHLNSFAMHVGQLLDFERPLEASGKVVASAHDQQRLLLVQLLGNSQNAVVLFQHLKAARIGSVFVLRFTQILSRKSHKIYFPFKSK